MKHIGDITKQNGAKIPPVDIVTGGSPCQDLSVAGKRAGLAGERSGLFMEQIRIIKEMREATNGKQPRFMVWENVPGAFSSNKGEDFRAVLEETAKVADKNAVIPGPEKNKWTPAGCIMGDGWSIAWRVHDAQFWGVPQRRKRISLVADFGGECAPEILFERKGLLGNITESGKEGEGIATDVGLCSEETSRTFDIRISSDGTKNWRAHAYPTNICRALDTGGENPDSNHGGICIVGDDNSIAFEPGAASRVGGHVYEDGVAGTVRANAGDNQQAVVYGISAYESNAMKSDNPYSGIYEAETSRTLDLNGGSPACNQGGMAVVCYDGSNITNPINASNPQPGDPCHTLHNDSRNLVVLEGNGSRPSHLGDGYAESETMYTLNSTEHHAVCIENHPNDSRVKISEDGMVQTLSGRMGTGGGNVPMVMEQQTFSDVTVASKASFFTRASSDNKAETLVATDYKDPQIVAYGLDRAAYNQGINAQYDFSIEEEKIGTQVAKGPGAVCTSIVRRLTPLECERLQGFSDYWTQLSPKESFTDYEVRFWNCVLAGKARRRGKKYKEKTEKQLLTWYNKMIIADSNRYKALGNSIALPFWKWMAARMVKILNKNNPTMGSLFDGIGGFVISFQEAGCDAVWASEIEEFPMAVTMERFHG